MAKTIIHKKSTVASNIPAAGDIEPGEIALNLEDGIVFSKHTDGSIVNMSGAAEMHQHSLSEISDSGAAAAAGVKNSIEINTSDIQLVGDAASPGNDKYYGTDGTGTKGYHDLPSGGSADYSPFTIAYNADNHSLEFSVT